MAIAKVTIPNRATQDKFNDNKAIAWTSPSAPSFWPCSPPMSSCVRDRQTPAAPRDVSDAVTRGNIALRAEIHTGDEFEELFHGLQSHVADAHHHSR